MRQSKRNRYRPITSGTSTFAVISGIRCAKVDSMPSTRSTIVVLYWPEVVSKIVPIGTRAVCGNILPKIAQRVIGCCVGNRCRKAGKQHLPQVAAQCNNTSGHIAGKICSPDNIIVTICATQNREPSGRPRLIPQG